MADLLPPSLQLLCDQQFGYVTVEQALSQHMTISALRQLEESGTLARIPVRLEADRPPWLFSGGEKLFAGAGKVGDRLRVLPALFHLMWCRRLLADLSAGPLGPATIIVHSETRL